MLSPPGKGYDCTRTWESLAMGGFGGCLVGSVKKTAWSVCLFLFVLFLFFFGLLFYLFYLFSFLFKFYLLLHCFRFVPVCV